MATTPASASKSNPAPPSDARSGSAQYEFATFILCTALGSGIAVRPGDPVGSKSGTRPAERPVAAQLCAGDQPDGSLLPPPPSHPSQLRAGEHAGVCPRHRALAHRPRSSERTILPGSASARTTRRPSGSSGRRRSPGARATGSGTSSSASTPAVSRSLSSAPGSRSTRSSGPPATPGPTGGNSHAGSLLPRSGRRTTYPRCPRSRGGSCGGRRRMPGPRLASSVPESLGALPGLPRSDPGRLEGSGVIPMPDSSVVPMPWC